MRLYRYRQFNDYSLQALEQSTLWCSDLRSFNDPYEAQFQLEVRQPGELDDLYDHWRRQFPDRPIYRKTVRFDALDILKGSRSWYGLCCFSELSDSAQMWGYYAASHAGFCLGFDFPPVSSDDTISLEAIHKVKYRSAPISFPVTKFLRGPDEVHKALLKLVTAKHTHWKHEREWRFINLKPNQSVKYEPTSLKEILVGARASRDDAEKLHAICERLLGEVKVRQFILMHGTYRLQLDDQYEVPDIG